MQAEERKDKEDKAKTPYLWNLNEDPALTAKIIHFTRAGIYHKVIIPGAYSCLYTHEDILITKIFLNHYAGGG